jgi:hypothetical protein
MKAVCYTVDLRLCAAMCRYVPHGRRKRCATKPDLRADLRTDF